MPDLLSPQENCYFFCSLIQQRLEHMHEGILVHGRLHYRALAVGTRKRVEVKLRHLYRMLYGYSVG